MVCSGLNVAGQKEAHSVSINPFGVKIHHPSSTHPILCYTSTTNGRCMANNCVVGELRWVEIIEKQFNEESWMYLVVRECFVIICTFDGCCLLICNKMSCAHADWISLFLGIFSSDIWWWMLWEVCADRMHCTNKRWQYSPIRSKCTTLVLLSLLLIAAEIISVVRKEWSRFFSMCI